jgi:hypothetical protein
MATMVRRGSLSRLGYSSAAKGLQLTRKNAPRHELSD